MNFETKPPTISETEHVDLSSMMQDSTLPLHQQAVHRFQQQGVCAEIRVFDLSQVHATPAASAAVKRAFLTPPYLIEQYARHYVSALFRAATRGNDKGKLILDPEASTYVHRLSNGNELVVQGETVEVDGAFTRRLTIACRSELTQGASA
jgi:hypothetical protein